MLPLFIYLDSFYLHTMNMAQIWHKYVTSLISCFRLIITFNDFWCNPFLN